MKISYSRTVILVGLCLPLHAQARVVTVYEEAAPVYVTSTAVLDSRPNGHVLPSPTPSVVKSHAPVESVPPVKEKEAEAEADDTETEDVTASTDAPTPEPEPATPTHPEPQANDGSSAPSLTISITNRYGRPLSIAIGSNYGCPPPDGDPQPTTITDSLTYSFPIGWAGRISVGKSLGGCNSLIEASYPLDWYRAVDVSYVDGYSVPITCSVDDRAVTGCNIELFDQGIGCDMPLDSGACPNSARSQNTGPAAPFFAPCQGSAYTYPQDDTATDGSVAGYEISCCIGTSCPTPPLQKSQHKRDVLPNKRWADFVAGPVSKRESSTLARSSPHLHQHQERHRMILPRSHIHQLVHDAKFRR